MLFNSRFFEGLYSNDTQVWKLSIINRIVWAKGQQILGLAYQKGKNKKFWNQLMCSVRIFYLKILKNSYW